MPGKDRAEHAHIERGVVRGERQAVNKRQYGALPNCRKGGRVFNVVNSKAVYFGEAGVDVKLRGADQGK